MTEDFQAYANGAGDPAQDNNNPAGADWTVTHHLQLILGDQVLYWRIIVD